MTQSKTLSFSHVVAAIRALEANGESVTARSVRNLIGFGSMTTITQHMREWRSGPDLQRPVFSSTQSNIPLSKSSLKLRQYLNLPATLRMPVGYHTAFVDDYIPNKSFLLPAKLREKLAIIGGIQNRQVSSTYARDILSRLIIDLSWASSRLEGNTYSLLDTKALIEEGVVADDKTMIETTMILNHKRAIEFIVDMGKDVAFSPMVIRNIHGCLSNGLLKNPKDEGALRTKIVEIGGSVYSPLQVPQMVEELFHAVLSKANVISDPFEQSFFAMVNLAYLQPFIDVNKRTSRLCANIPLIREGLVPLSFIDVSEKDYIDGMLGVYEKNDTSLILDVYEWAYERSAAKYNALKSAMTAPNPLLVKYRPLIESAIRSAVISGLKYITSLADEDVGRVEASEIDDLISLINARIEGLHEGNFSRYGIKPQEFLAYREGLGDDCSPK